MIRRLTSKRTDVANTDFCRPIAVPTYDNAPNNGPLSEVKRASGSLNPRRGIEEVSPAYAEAKRPTGGEEEFITEFSDDDDDEFVDCFLPNYVPTYDIVHDIRLLSEVGRAGSSNLQAGGEKDFCPIYDEAKSPTGGEEEFITEFSDDDDDEFVDCFLPNDVPTYDIVHDIRLLSEVGRAGSSNLQAGGEKDFCPIYDEAKSPTGGEEEFITEFSDDDDDEFVDCFLPNYVPTYDIVHDIRLLSEVGHAGSSNLKAGGEKDFCPIYDEAKSPTEKPPKSQNKFIKSVKEGWKKVTHPFSKKNEVKTLIPSEFNADSDNPTLKDDAGLDSPESKTKISPDKRKGIFGFLQKGKVKPVPTSQLNADPAIPDVREVVDLAVHQSKTKVCPKKHKQKASKSSFLDNFRRKKSKTVVPTQQLHADPAIPVAMDCGDLASRDLKTHISFDRPDLKADIAAANAELQTCVGSANIGPRTTISPRQKDPRTPRPKNGEKPRLKDTGNPGVKDDEKPGLNDAVKPRPKDAKKPGPKDADKPGPNDAVKPRPKDARKPGPKDAKKPRPEDGRKPGPKDAKKPRPKDGRKPAPKDADKPGPNEAIKPRPKDGRKPGLKDADKPGPNDAVKPRPKDGRKPGPKDADKPGLNDAVKPRLKDGRKPGLKDADKPGPNEAIKPRPKDGRKPGLKDADKPGPNDAVKPSPKDGRKPGPKDADKPGLNDAVKPRLKDARKPAAKDAKKPRPKDGRKPGPNDAVKPRPKDGRKPASKDAKKPRPKDGRKPWPKDADKPGPNDAVKPRPKDGRKPWPKDADKPGPNDAVKPRPKDGRKPAPKDAKKPRTKDGRKPGPKDADKPGPNNAVKPRPKDGKPWLKYILTNKYFLFKYDYSFRDVLGKGNYGKVYKGKRRSDGKEVAIKLMERTEEDKYLVIPGYSKPLLTEVALMLKMRDARSPFVLEMYDWYEDPSRFTLVLEYPQTCETLWDFIYFSDRPISESAARPLMYQAVQAVQDCLNHGVFHTDVRLENFLFDRVNRKLTLIDFGLGHLLTDDSYNSKDFRGALQCTPPEIHTKPKYYAMPTNVWALGILLYCMLHKCYPFPRKVKKSHKLRISKDYFSKEIRDLIKWCLDMNPTKRPTIQQILDHDWFKIE